MDTLDKPFPVSHQLDVCVTEEDGVDSWIIIVQGLDFIKRTKYVSVECRMCLKYLSHSYIEAGNWDLHIC